MTIERPMFPPVDPTRRHFLTVAAAGATALTIAPARAAPPPALPHVVDPVITLAERAVSVWDDFEEKCSATSKAEEPVIDWCKLNPRPELRPHTVGTTEDYLAFQAGLSTFDPNADLRAAMAEEQAAVNDWTKKKRSVEKEAGYIRAERAQKRASNCFNEIRDELCDMRPISVAGLRAKAQAARASSDEDLQQQIVYDIGVLFGDLDSNEKSVVQS